MDKDRKNVSGLKYISFHFNYINCKILKEEKTYQNVANKRFKIHIFIKLIKFMSTYGK